MLTPAQKVTLKANIVSIPAANTMYVDGNLSGLADFYNTTASPDYWVWRTTVPLNEVMHNGFDWTRVDNLSIGKARIWDWMFVSTDSIDATKPNIRAGIDATWVGTQADLAVRAVVYSHCQRLASRIEQLFATGAGTSVVNGNGPGLMSYEGPLNFGDLIGL